MGQIRCYGYSDDTAIIEGSVNSDADCFDSSNEYVLNAIARLTDENDEGCLITFVYTGCWSIGIGQIDEDEPIPSWVSTAHIVQGTDADSCRYSTVLMMDIPDHCKVEWIE